MLFPPLYCSGQVGYGQEWEKIKASSTGYSQTVFFPSTKQTQFCLASQIAELSDGKEKQVREVSFKMHMWTGVSFLGCKKAPSSCYKGIFVILWGFIGTSYNVPQW